MAIARLRCLGWWMPIAPSVLFIVHCTSGIAFGISFSMRSSSAGRSRPSAPTDLSRARIWLMVMPTIIRAILSKPTMTSFPAGRLCLLPGPDRRPAGAEGLHAVLRAGLDRRDPQAQEELTAAHGRANGGV